MEVPGSRLSTGLGLRADTRSSIASTSHTTTRTYVFATGLTWIVDMADRAINPHGEALLLFVSWWSGVWLEGRIKVGRLDAVFWCT